MLGLVGCSSSVTQQFNVPFGQAEAKLREMYPPVLSPAPDNVNLLNVSKTQQARFVGPTVRVRRDEVYDEPKERIVIDEGELSPVRTTEITLTQADSAGACDISVQSSKSKKSALFPSRDKAFEAAVMQDISAALK
jgi:hypothetical protein